MIADIIRLIQADKWEGLSDEVEIAKGKYEIPTTWRKMINLIRRKWQTKRTQSR